MALVKVKPTSPGRRAMVKVVTQGPAQGQARTHRCSIRKSRTPAVTTTVTSRLVIRVVVTSITTVSSISVATRTALRRRSRRLEYDPNRSANIALVLLRRRRAPLHHRPEGSRQSASS